MNEKDNQNIKNLLLSSNNSIQEAILNSHFSELFQKSIKLCDQNHLIQFIFSHFQDLYELFYSNSNPLLRKIAFSIICS